MKTNCSERPCEVCCNRSFRFVFEKDSEQFWRCRGCGLERIDPRPSASRLAHIYDRSYYDAWGLYQDQDLVRSLKRATFGRYLSWLPRRHGERLLDFGAATGFLMEASAELSYDPYGIELTESGASEINRKFGPERVFAGSYEDAVFSTVQSGGFAVVCMFDFLEHVRDPAQALRKAHEFLSVGGHVMITTPDSGSLTRYLMRARWPHFKVEHLYYFNRENLGLLLTRMGFEVTRIGCAWKNMNFKYVDNWYKKYHDGLITPLVRLMGTSLPRRVLECDFLFAFGEMVVLACKL